MEELRRHADRVQTGEGQWEEYGEEKSVAEWQAYVETLPADSGGD